MMNSFIERGATILREAAARFAARRDSEPIETVSELSDFASSRAAFVAQKKLYGYLKTRMGQSYPQMFESDVLIHSINIAKAHVFAACLSDMAVFVAASAGARGRLSREDMIALALQVHAEGIAGNAASLPADIDQAQWREAFAARVEGVNWENVAAGGDCFAESPVALVKWAPVAPEHKRYDAQIVRNSVRYAWIEVREKFRGRLVADAVAADWKAGGNG
jgi:hypothetical protein